MNVVRLLAVGLTGMALMAAGSSRDSEARADELTGLRLEFYSGGHHGGIYYGGHRGRHYVNRHHWLPPARHLYRGHRYGHGGFGWYGGYGYLPHGSYRPHGRVHGYRHVQPHHGRHAYRYWGWGHRGH